MSAPAHCVALTIAGSDSGGGAGIQADLKTFQRFGVYGATAITLVTVQNTMGVSRVELLAPDLVTQQIAAVAEDLEVRATKTGALGSIAIIEAVAEAVEKHALRTLVVDPVVVSKHGDALIAPEAIDALQRHIFPKASLVTPNLHEASVIVEKPIGDEAQVRDAARAICDLGAKATLVKGYVAGDQIVDILYDGVAFTRLAANRIDTPHTHGTGCTFSAAITALLAQGAAMIDAVHEAKQYISRAIARAPGIGHGQGPVEHTA